MDIYEARVRAVRAILDSRYGGNQAALSADTGVSPSYMTRMLKSAGEEGRKRIGDGMAIKLEAALDLEPGALLHPKTSERGSARPGSSTELVPRQHSSKYESGEVGIHSRRAEDRLEGGTVSLSLLDVGASMGHGLAQPQHEEVIRTMHVNETWLRRHAATFSSTNNLALVTGFGDSMEPTFKDGDSLLVDRGVNDIKLDAVYVLALHDELFIKRLQRRPGGEVVMISDNKSYEPYTIKNGERDKFQVLGRVVMAWNSRRI